jgi:hypothetical protein
MWELLAQTIPLALVGAISPLALMGALVLLAGYRPLLRCGLFTYPWNAWNVIHRIAHQP